MVKTFLRDKISKLSKVNIITLHQEFVNQEYKMLWQKK